MLAIHSFNFNIGKICCKLLNKKLNHEPNNTGIMNRNKNFIFLISSMILFPFMHFPFTLLVV